MKIGILDAISPEVSGIDWGGSPADVYVRLFESVVAPFTFKDYQVAQGQFPSSPAECDAYVISGSLKGAYDQDEWIAKLTEFIRDCYEAGIKIVGICFGHQIVAQALGGKVVKSEKGENFGLQSFEISHKRPWMSTEVESASLYFVHQDQVVDLPDNAVCLAGNDFCPIILFEIENRVLGIQGHPEFSLEHMRDILPVVANNINPELLDEFTRSLEKGKPESKIVAQWLVDFLLQA